MLSPRALCQESYSMPEEEEKAKVVTDSIQNWLTLSLPNSNCKTARKGEADQARHFGELCCVQEFLRRWHSSRKVFRVLRANGRLCPFHHTTFFAGFIIWRSSPVSSCNVLWARKGLTVWTFLMPCWDLKTSLRDWGKWSIYDWKHLKLKCVLYVGLPMPITGFMQGVTCGVKLQWSLSCCGASMCLMLTLTVVQEK